MGVEERIGMSTTEPLLSKLETPPGNRNAGGEGEMAKRKKRWYQS